MAEVIRMPRMSDTMEEGVIVGWLKEEGETVESGETLAEVETDKATMELDSYSDGVLLHIAVKEGAVPINGVIAVIGEEGEDWKAAIAAATETTNASESATATTEQAPEEIVVAEANTATNTTSSERIKASPLAKSMAKAAGLNLADIAGTGDQGRIVKRDIEKIIASKDADSTPKTVAPPTPSVSTTPVTEKPLVQPFTFNAGGGANFTR